MPLNNINHLVLEDDINVVLIQDSTDQIVLNSYSNLINFITFETVDTLLKVQNTNGCHFLRNRDIENTLEVHYTDFEMIELNGNGSLTNEGTLDLQRFELLSYESHSTIDLNLNCSNLVCAFFYGTVQATFTGNGTYTSILQSGFSWVDASNFIGPSMHAFNGSTGDLKVNATQDLDVELKAFGDIIYTGSPNINIIDHSGEGSLIEG